MELFYLVLGFVTGTAIGTSIGLWLALIERGHDLKKRNQK